MTIEELRTNHIEKPLGFQLYPLVLSWKVKKVEGSKQEKARVEIAFEDTFKELIFDSKEKQLCSAAYEPELTLEPATRYYWRVTVWSNQGEMAVSEPSWFETGLMNKPLAGKWITAPYKKDIHPIIRKDIKIDEEIQKARLYIVGLGTYEAYINGQKVGEEYLTPYFNDYNLWLQYQTYDVTDSLKKGDNTISVMLGNGWYKGRFGFVDKMNELYGDTMQLLCHLEICLKDGSSIIIGSDDSWSCVKSPVLESSIYDGEVYDANLVLPDWNKPGCDMSQFEKAVYADGEKSKVCERLSVHVLIKDRIKPVELIHTPAGETVLDFGQNMTGWVEFECDEPEGAEIFFRFGEILQNGNFYSENLRTAKEEYRYISNGKKAHVRPHFTFYGFRYVNITGIRNIKLEDFTGCVMYSDLKTIGHIETSNEKVNQLFHNAYWAQIGNFLDVPTDCPQRDERMGWTGDAQIFCATASFNMETPAFYRKYLYDMLLEQNKLEGSVPHVVPDILGQIYNEKLPKEPNAKPIIAHGSCAWGDAATVIPWTQYLFFGNKKLLEEQYQNMKSWTDYIKKIDDLHCNGSRLWKYGFHFADWLSLDNPDKSSNFGGTEAYYIASAYYLYSASLTSKAAAVLNREEDRCYYERLKNEIRAAIQKEYFTSTGRLAIQTQTALVVALYMDFVPEQFKERIITDLKEKLEENKIHLTTGFVGTPYLCPVLSENGLEEYAYKLLLNEDFPSWLFQVNMGATTIWERWNSVLPDGMVSDTGMNSLNHYAYGSIVEWMYRYMCGLNPCEDAVGFKKFLLKPLPDRSFQWAKMEYESPFGTIKSEWEYQDGGITYKVRVPFDSQAEFVLKNKGKWVSINGQESKDLTAQGRIVLEKGDYEIIVQFD